MRHKWMLAMGIVLAGIGLLGAECEEVGYTEGSYYWDGGILSGYSREGDNSMYTNWYTDTAISSDGDAGYISLGDGTFYSWD